LSCFERGRIGWPISGPLIPKLLRAIEFAKPGTVELIGAA
jgi:hypothetical protein